MDKLLAVRLRNGITNYIVHKPTETWTVWRKLMILIPVFPVFFSPVTENHVVQTVNPLLLWVQFNDRIAQLCCCHHSFLIVNPRGQYVTVIQLRGSRGRLIIATSKIRLGSPRIRSTAPSHCLTELNLMPLIYMFALLPSTMILL